VYVMQKLSTGSFVLHVLNSFSQRHVQITAGGIGQTSLSDLSGETKTVTRDHDPWD